MNSQAQSKSKQPEASAPPHGNVILRFSKVSFAYPPHKTVLNEVDFSVRRGAKITLMGQNGAGKSTMFALITGALAPEEGTIATEEGIHIATAPQVVPRAVAHKTIFQFFETAFEEKVYDLEPKANKMLELVHLDLPLTTKIEKCSGGQQARLLLAFALIQEPDILLLDEPTNNLDLEGIAHLTQFLVDYKKTCVVISHDAAFLNAFTHGVLYLDSFTHKVEQYVGNYLKVVEEIAARIERERRENVRLERDIQNRKEQMNFFAQKGGKMRDVARKMREAVEELEAQMVDMREEDKTIRPFVIPTQELENLEAPIIEITSVGVMHAGKPVKKAAHIKLTKREKLLITGPNGIGKSTLLEAVATRKAPLDSARGKKGIIIPEVVRIGHYRQDFSGLNFEETAYKALADAGHGVSDEALRSTAAQFLITDELLKKPVGVLSEGQKGLLSMAKIVLERPGLLVMDEPTNHINFRHLPVIAKALQNFGGALIVVSHMPSFVEQITFDRVLDLGKL